MGVKISDLTAASNVADANEFEINESGTSKKVTASQIKSYATNSTSVTAAGALMDSELADVSAVKGINQALTTTSAPTFNGMTTTGDITFGDNDRASFGAGDLLIFHDGSHSYLYETGTGEFRIKTNGNIIQFLDNSNNYLIKAAVGAEVGLYFNTAQKLVTTNTGCDISGTLTSDGLTVDKGSAGTLATFTDGVNSNFVVETASLITTVGNTGGSTALAFKSANTEALRIDASQNVQLGSQSSVTGGRYFDIYNTASGATDFSILRFITQQVGSSSTVSADIYKRKNGQFTISNNETHADAYTSFNVGASERLRLTSSGSVGIGISSPSKKLDVDTTMRVTNAAGTSAAELDVASGSTWRLRSNPTSGTNSYGLDFIKGSAGTDVKMSINSSGNVGIGTTPSYLIHADAATATDPSYIVASSGSDFIVAMGSQNSAGVGQEAFIGTLSNDALKIKTNNTERIRVDNSGNVGIGCIPTYKFEVDSGGIVAAARLRRTTDATLRTVLLFLSSSNSNTVGSVSINNTSTSYNTSSDYRLKENVVDLTGATDRLKQLEPKRFNFIADADTTVDGFLAHEVQSVVPEAITGTHNEVDDDGNAVMQGIDQGKLVPLLTAALQEAIDKIEILETKVAALEGA